MRQVGQFGLIRVGARLAAAAAVLAGAAACASATPAPSAHPQASSMSAAPVAAAQAGQPALVTAGQVSRHGSHPASPASSARSSASSAAAAAGAAPAAGNPAGNAAVPAAAQAVDTSHPDHVIGNGTPAGCTSAAVVQAVAAGGLITFDCGPGPVTITMTATAKVVNTSHQVVLDGGGKVTLSGAGTTRILYMNTCDAAQQYTTTDCYEQQWPQLVVQNLTLSDAYSAVQQASNASYGGGAIFDEGGQLKVVNSVFTGDRCYPTGPDLGGGAIRATGMHMSTPVYIVNDTFTGNSCSNGAALSGLFANFASTTARSAATRRRLGKKGECGGGSGESPSTTARSAATRRPARAPTRPRREPRAAAAAAPSTPTAPATTCWWPARC